MQPGIEIVGGWIDNKNVHIPASSFKPEYGLEERNHTSRLQFSILQVMKSWEGPGNEAKFTTYVTNTWQTIHNPTAEGEGLAFNDFQSATSNYWCISHIAHLQLWSFAVYGALPGFILMQKTSKMANPIPRKVWNPLTSHCHFCWCRANYQPISCSIVGWTWARVWWRMHAVL